MPAYCRTQIGSPLGNSPLINPLRSKFPKISQTQTLTLRMVSESGSTKRPTCTRCSKPTRICLCNRLKTPTLHNSVAITILQHTLEKNHPLNSTRIATIGLKNTHIITVSDVCFQAQFLIRLLHRSCTLDEVENKDVIDVTIEKKGATSSLSTTNFDQLFSSSNVAYHDLRKGFAVKKLKRKLLSSNEYEESEEFNIAVPSGSVLLFPSEESVDVEDVSFEVKNLIVLDGTWAKAKRMYNENPWLKLLPHIRLDFDKLSLYSEVRRQPRAGYLSTIESVVYALKAVGEDSEGLDGLLDVFESMVGDQRRCKDERLSKVSEL
ncbi:hypothetical protein ACJIZ3_006944 [Penstemon smallii]|uniref:tRNA-uridine aminocarboxypropyltransferase n=1 Tax=Penstemon smallii TaxID=265156 RepID=A0ABD3S977_9LAMI